MLDKIATLKPFNKETYDLVKDFVMTVLPLINKGFAGDMEALDEAEGYIREMELVYHSTPVALRRFISTLPRPSSNPMSLDAQQLLAALQPPTGWRRYRDLIVATVSAVIGGVVVFVIVKFVFGG